MTSDTTPSTQSQPQPQPQSQPQTNNNNNNDDDDVDPKGSMRFGKFLIPEASIFCRSSTSTTTAALATSQPPPAAFCFVNLRPIVRGHVLVAPNRIVPHLSDLTADEYTDLWNLVRTVQSLLQRAYPETTAFNVAVQDGRAAGQSVPHVHVHVLPRVPNDFSRNDDVYDALDAWAPTDRMAMAKEPTDMEVPDDADRIDRTVRMMADEAALYQALFEEGFGDERDEHRERTSNKE